MQEFERMVRETIQQDDLQGLIKHLGGRNLNTSLENGWTPLIHACFNGSCLIVDFLLEHGVGANSAHELFTPLMAVCSSDRADVDRLVHCAKALLNKHADVNAMERFKTTALMMACSKGHEKLVSLLLEENCEVDMCDNDGSTALHMACMYNQPTIVRMLVDYGASRNIKDRRRRRPIDIAVTKALDDIIRILEESKPEVGKVGHVTYIRKKTSFEELLSELPCYDKSSGEVGFSKDVSILLSGMRMEPKSDLFLEKKIGLAQFLNMKNKELKALGIQFSSQREKIIVGNKRFILHPWGSNALLAVDEKDLTLMDVVRFLANSVKHLHILWATSVFCYERAALPTEDDPDKIETLYDATLRAYKQTKALIVELEKVQHQVTCLEKVEKVQPADLILPLKPKRISCGKAVLFSSLLMLIIWKGKFCNFFLK